MSKTNKKDSNDGVFQVEKEVDSSLTGDGGKNPPTTEIPGGVDAATSAQKLKTRVSVSPTATVDVQVGRRVGSENSNDGSVSRVAAGFGQKAAGDDTSRIPYHKGNNRPDTPYGKKRFGDTAELDEVASELAVPKVDDAAGLHEKSSADQVYNGRKQFTKARGMKNYGNGPQTLLYDASADLDISSFILSTSGQILDNIEAKANYPTVDMDGEDIAAEDRMIKSNYLLESLHIETKDGHIKTISFKETQLPVHAAPDLRDMANLNWQIDSNNVTKAVHKLQINNGNEAKENWSPLGYAIHQPYEYNMLMHDIEATTGAIVATAYRAATSSLAYQYNIINKDGATPHLSAVRMFAEHYLGSFADGDAIFVTAQGNRADIFNKNAYKRGSAAAMIEMFDSVSKYKTKGDILTGQRSLPLTISKAKNNYHPFHVKKEFMKVLDKAHMYSTVDGSYSPMLPIYTTRKIRLINPMSLNFFLKDWKNPANFDSSDFTDPKRILNNGVKAAYGYKYKDDKNKYTQNIEHVVVSGLVEWLLEHEQKFVSVYGDNNSDINIPCDFDFMYPGMFQLMICAALGRMCEVRKDFLRDMIFEDRNEEYVWEDLTSLRELDPLASTQLTINGYDQALGLGKLAKDTKLRLFWGTNYTMLGANGNNSVTYAMPWYLSEKAVNSGSVYHNQRSGFFNPDTMCNMNYPSIRHGVRHSFVDIIHEFTESEARLALDRAIDIPTFTNVTEGDIFKTVSRVTDSGVLNDNVVIGALRYDNNSEGRLIVTYDTDQSLLPGGRAYINEYAPLLVAKELGWTWDGISSMVPVVTSVTFAPHSNPSNDAVITAVFADSDAITDARLNRNMSGGLTREIRSYRVAEDPLNDGTITRASATKQKYRTAYASPYYKTVNVAYTEFCKLVLSTSYEDGGTETLDCLFIPHSTQKSTSVGVTSLRSRAKTMWTILQRVMIPVNPFENCYDSPSDLKDIICLDPMEACFYFGFCGMLATDYNQAVLSRLNNFDQLELDYTEDVYSKTSLLFQ